MHIYLYSNPVMKTIHHGVNVTSTETGLFAIKYGINQATQISDISHIIVVTDLIQQSTHIKSN